LRPLIAPLLALSLAAVPALLLDLGPLRPRPAQAGAIVVIDGIVDSVLTDRVVVRTDIMKYTVPFSALNSEQREKLKDLRPEQRISVTVAVEQIARIEYINGALSY
jgi:hypothetical protein